MSKVSRALLGLFLISFHFSGFAQQYSEHSVYVDSLKHLLDIRTQPKDRVEVLILLSRFSADTMSILRYENQAMDVAELSRDRRLIVHAHLLAGEANLDKGGMAGKVDRAIEHFERGVKTARENDLPDLVVLSYCKLSRGYQYKGDFEKALANANEALGQAGAMDNDTAKVSALLAVGSSYLGMNEKLLSLRHTLEALDIAEKNGSDLLLRDCYYNLDHFYASINEYDKAIDFSMKIIQIDRKIWDPIALLIDEYHLGDLFAYNKDQGLALHTFEQSIALSDSIRFDIFKVNAYFRICNMYMNSGEYAKGADYLRAHPIAEALLERMGLSFVTNVFYAIGYDQQGKPDSAYVYFKAAEGGIDGETEDGQFSFWCFLGDHFAHIKQYPQALSYYQKAYALGAAAKDLDKLKDASHGLDSLYTCVGDFKTAYAYNLKYHFYQDSLQSLSRETDLMKLEVESDNRRRERLAREEELQMEHRHNLQYMAFTIGLVVLFILLVMLGWFAVPTSVIRTLGFLSFIFLFEFIIMLADRRIAAWTHEEPWKVLLIKIILAAGLVPLHHWLEHKVIQYLSEHRTGFHWPDKKKLAGGKVHG